MEAYHKRAERTPPRGRSTPKESAEKIFSRKTLRTFLQTVAIGAVLILVASLGAYFHPDPAAIIPPLGLIASAVTAFAGGCLAGRQRKNTPMLFGLTNGILLAALMLLLSFAFLSRSSHHTAIASALLHGAVPVLSVCGAFAAWKSGEKANERRGKRRTRR